MASQEHMFQGIWNTLIAFDNQDVYEQVLVGGAATPRRGPAATGYETAYDFWSHQADDTDSMYTTAYTASIQSDSTATTYASSVFSHPSAQSSARQSSRPAGLPANLPTFMETLQAVSPLDYNLPQNYGTAGPAPVPANQYPLWCEFRDLMNCNYTCRTDETDEWIQHHRHHLDDSFPSELVCWFCDHIPFVAPSKKERYSNFVDRMEHIREHINTEYKTPETLRPDFRMISHMKDQGHVSEIMYRAAMEHSELPHALRLPGGSASSSASSSSRPHQSEPSQSTPSSSEQGLAHDLARERRHQRPRGSHRSHQQPSRHRHHQQGQ